MRPVLSSAAALALSLILGSNHALAAGAGASVSKKDGVGAFLVDSVGQTLYVFKKDSPGQSACQGECIAKWPAYLAEGAPTGGLKPADFGTITRADGKKQSTYKGLPLYYFAADKVPGETKGNGVKDVWSVATP